MVVVVVVVLLPVLGKTGQVCACSRIGVDGEWRRREERRGEDEEKSRREENEWKRGRDRRQEKFVWATEEYRSRSKKNLRAARRRQ